MMMIYDKNMTENTMIKYDCKFILKFTAKLHYFLQWPFFLFLYRICSAKIHLKVQ